MSSNQCRFHRAIVMILIALSVAACAGYPGGPRTPQAGEDAYEVEEDGFLSVPKEEGILINDKPREGNTITLLTIEKIETESGGEMMLLEDGSFTYEPKENSNGMDQVTYTIRNEKGKTSEGKIAIYVTPVNDPPQPVDDHVEIFSDQVVTIDVLANDLEVDGDKIKIIAVGHPNSGRVEINGENTLIFTPQPHHGGEVSFTYRVVDDAGEWAEAWVFLTITDPQSSITLAPDTIAVTEDRSVTVLLSDLLINDTDSNGMPLTIIDIGQGQHGFVERNPDASLTYTPNPDFCDRDSFTYTVQSQDGSTASSIVTVIVQPVNDPPTISLIPDQTALAGSRIGPIPFTIEDPDHLIVELAVRAIITQSRPSNLIPDEGFTISGDNENRGIWISTSPNISGRAMITVIVGDGQIESSESFVLTVNLPSPPSTDTETSTPPQTDTETATATETITETDTNTEIETDTGSETTTNTEIDTGPATETETNTDTNTGIDPDAGSQTTDDIFLE